MVVIGMPYVLFGFQRQHAVRKLYEEMENFVRIGNLQLKRGNYQPAIDQFDRAIKTAHKIAPLTAYTESATMAGADVEAPWIQKGVAYAKMGMHKEALSSFATAININKGSDAAWLNKGIALAQLQQHRQAIAAFNHALKMNSRIEEAWNNRGNSFYSLGDFGKALESFDKALELRSEERRVGKEW